MNRCNLDWYYCKVWILDYRKNFIVSLYLLWGSHNNIYQIQRPKYDLKMVILGLKLIQLTKGIFTRAYFFDLISGIVGHLTNSRKKQITRLQYTWEKLVGFKPRSNAIECYRNSYQKENCARQSNFSVNGEWGSFSTWRISNGSYRHYQQNRCIGLRGKTYAPENSFLCHVINVLQNAYFYSHGHHGGSSQIGCAKTFRGFKPGRYGLGIYTGVDFNIW